MIATTTTATTTTTTRLVMTNKLFLRAMAPAPAYAQPLADDCCVCWDALDTAPVRPRAARGVLPHLDGQGHGAPLSDVPRANRDAPRPPTSGAKRDAGER